MGLAIAACGSSPSGASSPAAHAVQRALAATEKRAYDETFSEHISLDTSHLPSAEASRLVGISGTIVGTADVTDAKNFHIVVTLHGLRDYVRSVNGHLSVSQDGVNYQPAPASTSKLFSQLVSLAPGIVGHVQNAASLGTALLAGQTVNRYAATIPSNAVTPVFSTLNVKFGTPGPLHFIVDVSHSSGLPVRVIDNESSFFNLDKLNRPGVTGSFSVKVNSVRNFTYR
jgi:hypothetical protein